MQPTKPELDIIVETSWEIRSMDQGNQPNYSSKAGTDRSSPH